VLWSVVVQSFEESQHGRMLGPFGLKTISLLHLAFLESPSGPLTLWLKNLLVK
jgi:hypothetical protein